MAPNIIVVQPCCFARPNALCHTSLARLVAGLDIAAQDRNKKYSFWLTGDVSWRPGGPMLNELMLTFLREQGFKGAIACINGAIGTFAEPRRIAATAALIPPREKNILVISSDWLLRPARYYWEKAFVGIPIALDFYAVTGTGGWRTRLTYFIYGRILSATRHFGCEQELEDYLTEHVYQPRYERGFKMNGCR